MKKLFTCSFLLILAGSALAQINRPVTGAHPAFAGFGGAEPAKTLSGQDTLQDYFLNAQGYTIYNTQGGYLFGTVYDGFGALAIEATGLHFDSVGTNVTVTGVYGWFSNKAVMGGADLLKCELYDVGVDSMPTGLLGYGNASMAFLDTNNSINFQTLLGFQVFQINQGTNIVNDDFFIAMNYAGFDDTLGMVSTIQGDGLGQKRCRQLMGAGLGGTWIRAWDMWNFSGIPLDADPVFFPIVQYPATSVDQPFGSHGLKLFPVAPNPVQGDPLIRYSLDQPENFHLWVVDVTGKFIYDSGIVQKGPGDYEVKLDRSKLATGTYYYTAMTGKTHITSQFVIQ